MKLSLRFAIIAGILGIFYGFLAGAYMGAVVWGAFWIFIFGDNPWPSWTLAAATAVMAVGFFVVFFGAIYAGYTFGKRLEAVDQALRVQKIRSFYRFCAVAVVVFVAIIAVRYIEYQRAVAFNRRVDATEKNLTLQRQVLKILSVTAKTSGSDGVEIDVTMVSALAQQCKVDLAINHFGLDFHYTQPAVVIPAGESTQKVFIPYTKLVEALNAGINHNASGRGFSAAYPCTLSITPVLTPQQKKALPERVNIYPQELTITKNVDLPLDCTLVSGAIGSCTLGSY